MRGARWPEHGWLLAVLVAAAAVLRFATLDLQSLWYDEGQTVDVLRAGLGDLLGTAVPDTQNFPPLYFVLAWVWTKVFGLGEVGLRSLSALSGTLAVAAVYFAGAALASRRAGLAAAALAAFSPLLVWYSQEARPYELLIALGALSIVLFARARERPSAGRLAAWAACGAVALLTHYFAVFLLAGEAVLLRAAHGRRRGLLAAIGGLAAVAAALVPLAMHQESSGRGDTIADTALWDRVRTLPNRFLLGEQGSPGADYGWVHGLLYPLLALAVLAAWLAWRRARGAEREGAAAAAVLGAACVAGPLALAVAGFDFVAARNVILAWVPLALVAGCGFAAWSRTRWAGPAAMAALSLTVVVGVTAEPRLRRDDWRGAARALCAPHGPRLLLVTPSVSLPPLRFYLPDARPVLEPPPRGEVAALAMRPQGSDEVYRLAVLPGQDLDRATLVGLAVPSQSGTGAALLWQPAAREARWTGRCETDGVL